VLCPNLFVTCECDRARNNSVHYCNIGPWMHCQQRYIIQVACVFLGTSSLRGEVDGGWLEGWEWDNFFQGDLHSYGLAR